MTLTASTLSSGLQSGEILKQVIQQKTRKNPAYSLRAAARDLNVTPGYLSLITTGKKRLSFERALQFSQFLKMDETRGELFLRAVALESMKSPACRAFLENTLSDDDAVRAREFATLELDRIRILSEWYHVAVLDLTLLEQFKPDVAWVASELGITSEQVKSAVARLERAGLLEVTPTRWTKTSAKLAVPTTYSDRAIREFHEQMIDKALETLQSPDPDDFAAREISSVTFAVDPARMTQAKKEIEKFKRRLLNMMGGEGKCTALYQMNVQLFPLNKTRRRPAFQPMEMKK
jgi:uncharacterized protein (TIGR02147 family)